MKKNGESEGTKMIIVYQTNENGELLIFKDTFEQPVIERIVPRSWTHLIEPTEAEIRKVSEATRISETILRTALDEEETAHVDSEGDVTIIVVDTPILQPDTDHFRVNHFYTIPLILFFNKDYFVTSSIRRDYVVPSLTQKMMKNLNTSHHFKLTIQLLYRNASMFVHLLKQLDRESEQVQSGLQESLQNEELFKLMNLGKSLVYLSTGLNADLVVMERLRKIEEFKLFPEDVALLDDAMIENRQAIEMCSIHREIINGTMDAYASVISNNMNTVMKTLTVVTIALSIPMIVAGFFGMNFILPFSQTAGFWWAIVISAVLALLVGIFLARYTNHLKFRWGMPKNLFGLPKRHRPGKKKKK
ncbi:MAG TPA: magnesium transporter CorA family protein [Candidatus Izemoplasmatales bacterium]|nr:magnesium transporter CorA family protein [Bacillota bacterium]HRY78336.1 magnesium transporter CorA family protein [Candidatus Izemoplasmatales bacterium]